MAEDIEKSEFTSIFERIHGICSHEEQACSDMSCKPLFGFVAGEYNEQPQGISYALLDYLELVDWTGRIIKEDKGGTISGQTPPLLTALGRSRNVVRISEQLW